MPELLITGSTGRDRIYDGYPDVSLDMISSRTFDGQLQLLEYVPTVLAGPPGSNKSEGSPLQPTGFEPAYSRSTLWTRSVCTTFTRQAAWTSASVC
jgi:hypothetical protein